MYSMGIYDSGIGGLTTLAVLKKNFENCSFFFLADTLNNPLGTKSCGEIVKNVNDGIDVLRKNCHLQVVACNTASTVVKPKGTYIKGLSRVFSNITVQKHQFFSAKPSLWS